MVIGLLGTGAAPGIITTAHADISGPACVEDGDTLHINGERYHAACHGGEIVELYAIDAPELKQTCIREDTTWPCGRKAAAMLLRMTQKRIVTCRGNSRNGDDHLIAVCHVDGVDLNKTMVQLGFAVSDGHHYTEEEAEARTARRGLWAGPFEDPARWRAQR